MNEKDIICQYAKELKLATIRENISLFVEDATREVPLYGTIRLPVMIPIIIAGLAL